MKNNLQTVLGAGGEIGNELAKFLLDYTDNIRIVSRNPKKVNENDEVITADLTNPIETDLAVNGSSIVYLTVGLEYKASVWEDKWFKIITNVVASCKRFNAKLVFFDNVYMYDRNHLNPMTEHTPIKSSSRKGAVRQKVAEYLLKEIEQNNIKALIARSADFLGTRNSILIESVYQYLVKGSPANWLLSDTKIHNFTYTKDAAKATAFLGNTDDAYCEVWHLPTDRTPLTGKQWVEEIAKRAGVEPKYRVMGNTMLSIVGLFIPILRETKEMCYQYDRDYFFDSKKIEDRFQLFPTPYQVALDEITNQLKIKQIKRNSYERTNQ